jgi:hypothetical protein
MRRHIFAAAAAVALAGSAYAEPPPKGYQGGFERASILCDTQEQLQSIIDAFSVSAEAAQARYAELFATMNEKREPTCAVTAIRTAVTGEAIELGTFEVEGSEFRGWSVHIENAAGEGYYLYLESSKAQLMKTI